MSNLNQLVQWLDPTKVEVVTLEDMMVYLRNNFGTPVGLPGDYNIDNRVDTADYIVWRKTVGTTNLAADGNGDGTIDAKDYDVWRAYFGKTFTPSGAGSGAPGSASAFTLSRSQRHECSFLSPPSHLRRLCAGFRHWRTQVLLAACALMLSMVLARDPWAGYQCRAGSMVATAKAISPPSWRAFSCAVEWRAIWISIKDLLVSTALVATGIVGIRLWYEFAPEIQYLGDGILSLWMIGSSALIGAGAFRPLKAPWIGRTAWCGGCTADRSDL